MIIMFREIRWQTDEKWAGKSSITHYRVSLSYSVSYVYYIYIVLYKHLNDFWKEIIVCRYFIYLLFRHNETIYCSSSLTLVAGIIFFFFWKTKHHWTKQFNEQDTESHWTIFRICKVCERVRAATFYRYRISFFLFWISIPIFNTIK